MRHRGRVLSDRKRPFDASKYPDRGADGRQASYHSDLRADTGTRRPQGARLPAADWTRRGLLGAVAATLIGLTVASRNWIGAESAVSFAALNARTVMPPQPEIPRKQMVPVRASVMTEHAAVPASRVALRQLVIATDADDFELPAWKTILDQIGTPYDVLLARREALGMDRLVRRRRGRSVQRHPPDQQLPAVPGWLRRVHRLLQTRQNGRFSGPTSGPTRYGRSHSTQRRGKVPRTTTCGPGPRAQSAQTPSWPG